MAAAKPVSGETMRIDRSFGCTHRLSIRNAEGKPILSDFLWLTAELDETIQDLVDRVIQ